MAKKAIRCPVPAIPPPILHLLLPSIHPYILSSIHPSILSSIPPSSLSSLTPSVHPSSHRFLHHCPYISRFCLVPSSYSSLIRQQIMAVGKGTACAVKSTDEMNVCHMSFIKR
eukprot:GHVU01223676.1.p4 GENE.GHVU01223676.1~~GHVU01223676.1.p4  ORF type:complete len:113 (+),score=3.21 GHVU01223676.1:193-531(+)